MKTLKQTAKGILSLLLVLSVLLGCNLALASCTPVEGGDTDTTGSVTGGRAGIYDGLNGDHGIPAAWSHALVRYEWIESLCARADALMR